MIEEKDCYKVEEEFPGFTKDEIEINVKNEYLIAIGENNTRSTKIMSILIPENSKKKQIQAKLKNGILYIVIPKKVEDFKVEIVED